VTDLDRAARPVPETVEEVEARLKDLARRFKAGDVAARRYARLRQDLLAHLGRCRILPQLEPGESLIAEHHWVEPTARLPESPLEDAGLGSVSLYATTRRLFRWRFQDRGAQTDAAGARLDESLDVRWYTDITALLGHRETRWGEAAAGLAIAAAAALLYGHLAVTAPFILAVGLFGVAHALLVPTRRVALRSASSGDADWLVSAVATPSGRALVASIRDRVPPHAQGV
jgi:hypothetical protein